MSLTPPNRNPLLITDIFHVILYFLSEQGSLGYRKPDIVEIETPSEEGRRALAALAQTCRMFSEPSLNYLWRKLDSLRPLLRCLFTKEIVDTGVDLRPPSLAEWCIINRYSHRIRELAVRDDESLFLLKCSAFELNFLPNLRVLSWDVVDDSLAFIRPLLGSQLVSFRLCLELDVGDHGGLTSFLKTLPSHCPGLKFVCFDLFLDEHNAESITPFISWAVCGLEKLSRLDIRAPILDDVTLRHLVMSPRFTDLVLTIRQSQLEDISLLPSDTPFSGTKDITISRLDLGSITGLLRSEGQMFSSIGLHLDVTPTPQLTLSFLTLLASLPRRSSLKSIVFIDNNSITAHPEHEDIHYSLSHDTLRPLVFFRNLRELKVDLTNPISLNDEELVDLARGWPLLRLFRLVSANGLSAKCVTLQGLLLLAVTCPKLVFLALCLDAREVPTNGVHMDVRSTTVKHLHCPWSPINDPRLVGMFLSRHFPSIDWVMGQGVHSEKWRQVFGYLL